MKDNSKQARDALRKALFPPLRDGVGVEHAALSSTLTPMESDPSTSTLVQKANLGSTLLHVQTAFQSISLSSASQSLS